MNASYGKTSKVFIMKGRYKPGIKKVWGTARPEEINADAVMPAQYINYTFDIESY